MFKEQGIKGIPHTIEIEKLFPVKETQTKRRKKFTPAKKVEIYNVLMWNEITFGAFYYLSFEVFEI